MSTINSFTYRHIYQDTLSFLGLLVSTILVKMMAPQFINNVFLVFTLFLFFISKKNWFWIVYLSVITFDVGGIFGIYYSGQYLKILFLNIPYFFWFALTASLKVLYYRLPLRNKNYFKKPIVLWVLYFTFSAIFGIVVFGKTGYEAGRTGLRFEYDIIRFIVTFSFFFSLPRLLYSFDDLTKFSRLIFILVFISLFGQLYNITTGTPLNMVLRQLPPEQMEFLDPLLANQTIDNPQNMIRSEWGANIRIIGLLLSILFFSIKEFTFSRKYLGIIILVILFSSFITGTRGWTIAFVFIILATLVTIKYRARFSFILITGIVFFAVVHSLSPKLQLQTNQVMSRLSTLSELAEGDLTAGGTNTRLTERSYPVMEVFREHPIIGVGLSGKGMKVGDAHVGNQTILMGEGVIGLLIFLYFIFYTYRTINRINSRSPVNNIFHKNLHILNVVFIGLLIIHSSSSGLFGLINIAQTPGKIVFLALFLTLYNIILNTATSINHDSLYYRALDTDEYKILR